jgi:PleD family two-component response regulator
LAITARVYVGSGGHNLGASFTIALPVARSDAAAPRRMAARRHTGDDVEAFAAAGSLSGVKVLVVDDEADSRDLLTTILTQCGSDVRCSESAADAMETFHEWNPDLLVSDIGMPNEDGYSLIKRLRGLESARAREIPPWL